MGNIASYSSSAGVYLIERDESQFVAAVPTTIGAIVGETVKGPVGVPVLVTSRQDYLALYGKPDPKVSFLGHSALAFLEYSNRLYVIRVAPGSLYGGAIVSLNNNLNQITALTNGLDNTDDFNFTSDQLFLITGANQGSWNNDIRVDIYPNTKVSVPDTTFFVDVYLRGQSIPVEHHLVSLRYENDGYGTQIQIEEFINKYSSYIRILQNKEATAFVVNPNRQIINTLCSTYLVGGINWAVDSNGLPVKATKGQIMLAWDLFRDPEVLDISILINGGYSDPDIQRNIDDICQSRMDCIGVLDMPSTEQSMNNAVAYRRTQLQLDSSYSALYSPDYLILDEFNDLRLYVPPSGYVAAAYARTDTEQETWFTPAGMDNGRLSALGVRVEYDQGDRDVFEDNQINPTRVVPGSGIRIWGATTLQTMASSLSNVNVRRLMIFLEKSLSRAALYSVFDPNDEILWAKLTDLCETFLQPIKDGRGLYGFKVQCDSKNNLPSSIAAGNVILDVYVDPVLPAKRIHLIATVTKTGALVTAVNG